MAPDDDARTRRDPEALAADWRDEGNVSAVVALACGVASVPLALLAAAWTGFPPGIVAMALGSWHASRGERPVVSSLAVPFGLAGVVTAGWQSLA